MTLKASDHPGILNIPEAKRSVGAAGDRQSAVLRIGHASNALAMTADAVQSPARGHLPEAQVLIVAAGKGVAAVGRDGQAGDHSHGRVKSPHDLARVHVAEV